MQNKTATQQGPRDLDRQGSEAWSQDGRVLDELYRLGMGYVHTARIHDFLIHPGFPVDIRHNAQIGREQLAAWAAKEMRWRR